MSSPLPFDPYETLGVSKTADKDVIRTAHRKLVLKYHPDKIKDPTEKDKSIDLFQKVQQSYELLIDEGRRHTHDQKVKLAELRREAMRDQPIRSASYPVRPSAGSSFEYRDGRIVEERAPKFTDDDRYFEEPRTTSRKYDGYERERKTSTTYPEKDKRSKYPNISTSIKTKLSEKASSARDRAREKPHHSEAKAREKERKREASDKHSRRAAYVEDPDDSSDSDTATIFTARPQPRRAATYDDRSRTVRMAATPRKKETKRSSRDDDYSDEWDSYRGKHETYHNDARDYIARASRGAKPFVEDDDRSYWSRPMAKPSGRRSGSDREGRRSGSDPDDRKQARSKSSKSRRPSIDIVEPRIIPSMPKHTSSPANLKIPTDHRAPPPVQRATTAQFARDHRRDVPAMPRSNTTPLASMASRKNDTAPARGSKLKHTETQDSGYGSSSPATPDYHGTSPPKSTKYMIVDEPEDYSRSHRTVLIDPDSAYHRSARSRSRERDRDGDRDRTPRPSISTRASHAKSSKSGSYSTVSPEASRPAPVRQGSSRPSTSSRRDKLFGQEGFGTTFPEEKVRYAQPIGPDSVNYAPYGGGRRASADHFRERDYFDQPRMSRKETAYA
ncbi:MAG: hypothetical protein Q9227_004111 [Pyrenula ochraceoflavens]